MSSDGYYEQTSAAEFMHNLPRFGHTSEFSKLASSNQTEQTDYVIGVIAISFFILSLFFFWAISILTCKCMGYQRTSIFSGQRARVITSITSITSPSSSSSDNKDHQITTHSSSASTSSSTSTPLYLTTVRCTFMILGCCMILLGVTLVGPGLSSTNSTSASIRKLNRDVKDLITQGLLIMDSVKRVRWNIDTLDIDDDLLQYVETACPNLDNDERNVFMSNAKMRSSLRGLERDFDTLKDYLRESDFEGIRSHVDHVMDGTEYIDAGVGFVDRNDWTLRMFALLLNVLVLFMILAGCTSLMGRRVCHLPALRWMSELLILPLFVILIVVSWGMTSLLAIASISNADFCSGNSQQGGPAGTVMNVFEERGISNDDVIFTTFTYYQSGCATDDPIKGLYKYEDDIQGGIASANEFLTQADQIGIDEINEQCGASVRPIIEGIGLIKDNLGILLSALRSTFELASCAKMSPIYRQVFEGTACIQSSGSLTLMFSIMFGINVVGMVMIMLRSAMYPYKKVYASSNLDDEDDEEDEWEEYQAYLGYMASFVTMWGGNTDEDGSKTGTNETSASTEESITNTPGSSIPSTDDDDDDEESPPSPHQHIPAHHHNHAPQSNNFYEPNEEMMPLSPASISSSHSMAWSLDLSRMRTPQTKQFTFRSSDEEKSILDEYEIGRAGDVGSLGGSSPRRRRRQQQHREENTYYISPVKQYHQSLSALMTETRIEDDEDGDERNPLSPNTPSLHSIGGRSILETRIDHDDHDDDERNPLSPNTPSIHLSGRRIGLTTPDFRTSGLPETPLMTSPTNMQQDGRNYFGSIISPLRSNVREGGPVKKE